MLETRVRPSIRLDHCDCLPGLVELERTTSDDLLRLTVPPPTDDCYTSNGYLKKKCQYDKNLADLYKVCTFVI